MEDIFIGIAERIAEMKAPDFQGRKQRWTFTLEAGRGQTYAHGQPTLYGHSTYKRGSVLAGRPQRVFVHQWDDWAQARADLAGIKKKIRGFRFDDFGPTGGTTHIDVDVLTQHLPDGDY